jgi:hypothetical protein
MIRNIYNYKENVYFSNMKKIFKRYPMTGQLIVTWGYSRPNWRSE